jgi:putative iron-dependent peroxidase
MSTDILPVQPAVLKPLPPLGRKLTFRLVPGVDPRAPLSRLASELDLARAVVGIGEPLVRALGRTIAGLRPFPALAGAAGGMPSTQQALWVSLNGADRGELFDATQAVVALLGGAFVLDDALDVFFYGSGRDLTGYEDGTENPKGDDAVEAAVVSGGELRGSCFVAVQRWSHDLAKFRSFDAKTRDDVIGRAIADNEELEDAPETAHVKRTAQESFTPAAFMLRRSMPWATARDQGLEFIAYVANLDAFEKMLARMAGLEDGIVDALFTFSRPLTGGYYWVPPVVNGRLDLSAVGI